MKDKITNHSEWLEQQPVFEGDNKEVFENADGSQYIPVGIVEGLLDWFTDKNWETNKFQFRTFEIGGKSFVSGSLELSFFHPDLFVNGMMRKNIDRIGRTVIGCATVDINTMMAKDIYSTDITDYEATILSLALCNAAKKLGNRFGRSLNGRGVNKVEDKKEIPSISELDAQIEKVKSLIIEGGTYDNAIYLITVVYPNLRSNDSLNKLAESLKK